MKPSTRGLLLLLARRNAARPQATNEYRALARILDQAELVDLIAQQMANVIYNAKQDGDFTRRGETLVGLQEQLDAARKQ